MTTESPQNPPLDEDQYDSEDEQYDSEDEQYDSEDDQYGRPAHRDCPDCRPNALDSYHCQKEGVRKRAEYDEQHKDGPTPEQYDMVRLAYGKARHEVTEAISEVRDQLERITDSLRCTIDDEDILESLDEAWRVVRHRLRECGPRLGCQLEERHFDTNVESYGSDVVRSRIAEYDHQTVTAEQVFKKLTGEPERLRQRVADLQAEVSLIAEDMSGDPAGKDFKKLYARALVAGLHLKQVWWGFDHAHDFVDCLCLALRISLEGREALSILTGELAIRVCRKESRKKRCQHLREHVVDGIIEEYVRQRLPRHPHDEGESESEAPEQNNRRREPERENRRGGRDQRGDRRHDDEPYEDDEYDNSRERARPYGDSRPPRR